MFVYILFWITIILILFCSKWIYYDNNMNEDDKEFESSRENRSLQSPTVAEWKTPSPVCISGSLRNVTGVLRAPNRKRVCRVFSLILMQSDTHNFHDVTHCTHIFHFLQIRCRAVPARCRPSTKHLMLMPIFGYRFHFAVKERCCCCCWFILMQQTHTFPWRDCVCTRFRLGARKTPVIFVCKHP